MGKLIEVPEMVLIESPYCGNSHKETPMNVFYARACVHDALFNNREAPFASHLLFTQIGITDDEIAEERRIGMGAGWVIGEHACRSVFYTDFGWSSGMIKGAEAAEKAGRPIVERSLGSPEEVASMIERLTKVRSSVNEGIWF